MDVASSQRPRRGTPLPLSQLVEESRSGTSVPSVPSPPLESKFYVKLKGNGLIQAEPPELHFRGFELGKEYVKLLKLTNVSSEVMNIHILPSQTKHFQTTYSKKSRLIPGLAYTLRVAFSPDEWRYFYDCIRVHCTGDDNLFIPLHAYPVIDDLSIPSQVHLPAVPLGQSVSHSIPLRCSCPIDFEFQVFEVQAHASFSVRPLTGVIPANGEVKVTVTFTPTQYETCQLTLQLVVSQFSTKPFLCTISGCCAPQLALSPPERTWEAGLSTAPPAAPLSPRGESRPRVNRERHRLKVVRNQTVGKQPVDVCTPAGVAKMLIRDDQRLGSRELREGLPRDRKGALFLEKVQRNVKEEQTNHLKWRARLGQDPMSDSSWRRAVQRRDASVHEHMVKMDDVRTQEDTAEGRPKLSVDRLLRDAGQTPDGAPAFQFHSSVPWELRRRALRRFQQAARTVLLRWRLCDRLRRLRSPGDRVGPAAPEPDLPPDTVFLSPFPFFTEEEEPLAEVSVAPLPVGPVDSSVKSPAPFFPLQVCPRYQTVGYKPVSPWEAFTSYIPHSLLRPLRTPPQPQSVTAEEELEAEEGVQVLSSSVPEALLKALPACPLRIFNPAPGLQVYKSPPTFLQGTLEVQLRPQPRYDSHEGKPWVSKTRDPRQKEVVPGMTMWTDFNWTTADLNTNRRVLPGRGSPTHRSQSVGVQLTPDTIRAEFMSEAALVSNGNPATGVRTRHQSEAPQRSEVSRMGRRVTARLKQLELLRL